MWALTFLQVTSTWITLKFSINEYFLCSNLIGSGTAYILRTQSHADLSTRDRRTAKPTDFGRWISILEYKISAIKLYQYSFCFSNLWRYLKILIFKNPFLFRVLFHCSFCNFLHLQLFHSKLFRFLIGSGFSQSELSCLRQLK